jgi:TPR repeat protein
MYAHGLRVIRDAREAMKWYRKAAEQGIAAAQFGLALMYDTPDASDGLRWVSGYRARRSRTPKLRTLAVYEDFAVAAGLRRGGEDTFQRVANQGIAAAQFNLGRMYERGHGVARDFREAAALYQKAADRGDPAAQFNLGTLYYNGRGVPKDLVETHKWMKIAVSRFQDSMPEGRERATRNLKW